MAEWERAAPGPTGTISEPQPLGWGLRHEIRASDWQPAGAGQFTFLLPQGALRASGLWPRLIGRGREYPVTEAGRELSLGEVRLSGNQLALRLAAETPQAPPCLLVLGRPDGTSAEHAVRSADWKVGQEVGTFVLELPKGAVPAGAPAPRLFADLVRIEAQPGSRDEARALAPFEYRFDAERLTLGWPGTDPPPAMQLTQRLENGRDVDGTWQLRLGRFCGNGIPVWSGGREELRLDVPPASELSFRFAYGAHPGSGSVTARVRLDGAPLFERRFAAGSEPEPVALALPDSGVTGARLAFELVGAPGIGVFFAPTVGPRERGTPAARPWPARPDIVLFVADTLRADSLALHGGDPALAPNLNRFAEASLRFPAARSNAAWTLPSIGSMLTGLHPGQHGATDEDLTLAGFHTTIAEALARAGYRTGAITDGSFFSPIFGLEQGFEWFAQRDTPLWDLDRTLAEARDFLERDDGRPLFLVVHTYRVHQPYRTGADEDRSRYDALFARARVAAGTGSPEAAAGFDVLAQQQDELRELYHAGVRDLDRGFGELVAALEARRFFEHGVLVLTSDHGEALGENREFFHGRTLWEVKLRVPLLLRGARIPAREVPFSAGPIDLPPTFAELAGLPADPSGVGRSLLGLDAERPSFAFQLAKKKREVVVREGALKVFLTPERERVERGACDHAFELDGDPLEARDVARSADWPAELAKRLAPALFGYLAPRGPAEPAGVPAAVREQLDAIGYGGGNEDVEQAEEKGKDERGGKAPQ